MKDIIAMLIILVAYTLFYWGLTTLVPEWGATPNG